MIVVADASVLVAELLRERGRALFTHPNLRVVVAEGQWQETENELGRRAARLVELGRLTAEQARLLHDAVHQLIDDRVIELMPRSTYLHLETTAKRRIRRDHRDWAPIALALALDCGILTRDHDFLGCGCPTWTVETLRQELHGG